MNIEAIGKTGALFLRKSIGIYCLARLCHIAKVTWLYIGESLVQFGGVDLENSNVAFWRGYVLTPLCIIPSSRIINCQAR